MLHVGKKNSPSQVIQIQSQLFLKVTFCWRPLASAILKERHTFTFSGSSSKEGQRWAGLMTLEATEITQNRQIRTF